MTSRRASKSQQASDKLAELAERINVTYKKSEDYRVTTAVLLGQAKDVCEKNKIVFKDWLNANVVVGAGGGVLTYSAANKLANLAVSSGGTEAKVREAVGKEREAARERMSKARAEKTAPIPRSKPAKGEPSKLPAPQQSGAERTLEACQTLTRALSAQMTRGPVVKSLNEMLPPDVRVVDATATPAKAATALGDYDSVLAAAEALPEAMQVRLTRQLAENLNLTFVELEAKKETDRESDLEMAGDDEFPVLRRKGDQALASDETEKPTELNDEAEVEAAEKTEPAPKKGGARAPAKSDARKAALAKRRATKK